MSTSYHKHDKKASPQGSASKPGFTIVELLIVIVVVAILAAISIIAYNGITKQAAETTLKSDLKNAATQLGMHHSENGDYPDAEPPGSTTPPSNLKTSPGNTFQYTSTGSTYCLTATSTNTSAAVFNVSSSGGMTEGSCPGHSSGPPVAIEDGVLMQLITSANCPTERTRAVDARDNRTYWVQEMPDGRCWMLTNLAYAGGGVNTYSDTKALSNGTRDTAITYTEAKYYIPPGANPTTEPASPSTSTDGAGQYGYLYNWCAAMGAQTTTSACANATTPAPDTSTSICPKNWRLPTGETTTGEFTLLNNAINGGLTNTDTGLRSWWLAQRSGYWSGGLSHKGGDGRYWSSTQYSATAPRHLLFHGTSVNPADASSKGFRYAVRCIAA